MIRTALFLTSSARAFIRLQWSHGLAPSKVYRAAMGRCWHETWWIALTNRQGRHAMRKAVCQQIGRCF